MAQVISVSVPDDLFIRWKESDLSISPSFIFQTALEAYIGSKNQLVPYWSDRALKAEKKLEIIKEFLKNDSKQ